MKNLLLVIVTSLLVGCSGEEFDFSGTYEAISLRDECPDPSGNAQINATTDGICLRGNAGIECIQIELDIDAAGNFTMRELIGPQALGGFIPLTVNDYSGTYSTSDNIITLNRNSASTITMSLDDAQSTLDWKVTTTSAGCDRYYRFRRQL